MTSTNVPEKSTLSAQRADVSSVNFTNNFKFSRANLAGDELFSVCAGVPAEDALNRASSLLAAAIAMANEIGEESDVVWGIVYLLEMTKATVDAVNSRPVDSIRS